MKERCTGTLMMVLLHIIVIIIYYIYYCDKRYDLLATKWQKKEGKTYYTI